jgi:hypothetical protein
MHSALAIAEIRQLVLEHLLLEASCVDYSQPELATAARVCKAWLTPTVEILWSTLYRLMHLIELLGALKTVEKNEYVGDGLESEYYWVSFP